MQSARGLAQFLAQHRDAIAPPLGRVVPQRIVAPYRARFGWAEPHPDMRAGAEARQVMPVRVDQLVAVDVFREVGDRTDAQLHRAPSKLVHCYRSGARGCNPHRKTTLPRDSFLSTWRIVRCGYRALRFNGPGLTGASPEVAGWGV